jgi:hypothetical protein
VPEISPASRTLAEASRGGSAAPRYAVIYADGVKKFMSRKAPELNRAHEPRMLELAQCTFQPEPRKPIPPPSNAPIDGVRPTSPRASHEPALPVALDAPLSPHERLYAHALFRQVSGTQGAAQQVWIPFGRQSPRASATPYSPTQPYL